MAAATVKEMVVLTYTVQQYSSSLCIWAREYCIVYSCSNGLPHTGHVHTTEMREKHFIDTEGES
jgi:hypothetical protein